MSAWMHKVLAYLDRQGKGSYPQPWWPSRKRLRDPREFCDLPIELVLHIISFIQSDVDRLCLALTCKSLLEITNCWPLPDEFKESTRGWLSWIYARYYPVQKISRDRWQLLKRLENADWRCCMGCCKLHPVNEFRTLDLWTNADRRTCIFGKLVGVVRLCPCIEMTFRDKLKITKELIRQQQQQQQQQQSESGSEADHNRGLLPGFDPVTGQHECIHECDDRWDQHKRIKVQRKLKFNLDADHNLILEAEYKVRVMRSRPGDADDAGTLLLCPHMQVYKSINAIDHLEWDVYMAALRRARSNAHMAPIRARSNANLVLIRARRLSGFVRTYRDSYSCPWCEMTIFDIVEKRYMDDIFPRDFTFKTRRSLGNAIENADNTWYRQTETSIENQHWVERRRNAYYTEWNTLKRHEASQ